ncbi:uncharacterized protein LOC125240448 [Leguminivora glycinivorella]|uniref:uncharacterized protein LOC125240448 n=1 Tax=Leguminivora glycinivorella TaxID=1035111 RepID=UPI00200FBBD4|nr:uncharacterized protein LOC125240448 [Leguminivora glycinivorella]
MVTAPHDDWTEELCIRLIHEYKKRPILWDPRDPFFFKKAMKPEAWEGIGAVLNLPADMCKHKMVILQSSFRREKSKIMQSIRDSAGDANYTSTWFAFEEMAFLINKDSERKRHTTQLSADSEDGPSAIKKSLLEHYIEKSAENKKKHKNSLTTNVVKVLPNICPKKLNVSQTSHNRANVTSTVASPVQVASPPATMPPKVPAPSRLQGDETLEEIKSFTNFIAFKMKKYSETTKNYVQQAICDIIFKADQHIYDNMTSDEQLSGHQSPQRDAESEDGDIENKTIDIGNGQVIIIKTDDSD